MKNQTKEELRQHHINSYRETVIEIIKNNTNSLVDTDIMSLIKKPPLDSMDLIQVKLLSLAKKNNLYEYVGIQPTVNNATKKASASALANLFGKK